VLIAEDIAQVRTPGVMFHVVREPDGLYLIDAGFIGALTALGRTLRRLGWGELPVRGVLLTHGHLDHTLNLRSVQVRFGAWVAAPRLDESHLLGRHPYRGSARICGWLEALGRALLRYKSCAPDRWLQEGDELPILGGLRVIGLPGHTVGHVGFYSASRRLLFTGDLFASHWFLVHPPPFFLNTAGKQLPQSLHKALGLELSGVIPNHGDRASPEEHLRRLRSLVKRHLPL
jgi:glyoxylase-like metal-dependent hydrolase (beta-lactamase superfamily II)